MNGGQPINLTNMSLSNYSEVSLPPISSTTASTKIIPPTQQTRKQLDEYENALNKIRGENAEYRFKNETIEKQLENLAFENTSLQNKLENLENVFVGSPLKRVKESDLLNKDDYYMSKVQI